eukprot:TRINITY_DN51839_c0_g1_i1.p1 TRINITY_DN51839_c0_g1~~TRINITY_DN51839_c0_g1_i1.p1  ORF type:complete len:297 (+),score=62.22 TRINITY_DN51839_c0_g1_i1:132-1022(+)
MRSSGLGVSHVERSVQVLSPTTSNGDVGAYQHHESALAPKLAPTSPISSTLRPASGGPSARPRGRVPAEIEQMILAIDQRTNHVAQAEDARIRMLADQTQRHLESLQALRVAREIQEERRRKEMRMVENNVMLDLNSAKQARAELESRIDDVSKQHVAAHQQELARQREQFQKTHDDHSREIGGEIVRISAALDEHRVARVECGERIAAGLESEFNKVQEAILTEQKLRFDAESTMLKMVEDVCSRIRGEIHQERLEREAVQGKLLSLLEESTNRIETGFSFTGGYISGYHSAGPL